MFVVGQEGQEEPGSRRTLGTLGLLGTPAYLAPLASLGFPGFPGSLAPSASLSFPGSLASWLLWTPLAPWLP